MRTVHVLQAAHIIGSFLSMLLERMYYRGDAAASYRSLVRYGTPADSIPSRNASP